MGECAELVCKKKGGVGGGQVWECVGGGGGGVKRWGVYYEWVIVSG